MKFSFVFTLLQHWLMSSIGNNHKRRLPTWSSGCAPKAPLMAPPIAFWWAAASTSSVGAQVEIQGSRIWMAGLMSCPQVERHAFLSPEETQRLVAAIEGRREPHRRPSHHLPAAHGSAQARHSPWPGGASVDWDKRSLLVPMAKSGRPRTIALTLRRWQPPRESSVCLAILRIFPSPCHWPTYGVGPGVADYLLLSGPVRCSLALQLRTATPAFSSDQGALLFYSEQLRDIPSRVPLSATPDRRLKTLLDATEIVGDISRRQHDCWRHSAGAAVNRLESSAPGMNANT